VIKSCKVEYFLLVIFIGRFFNFLRLIFSHLIVLHFGLMGISLARHSWVLKAGNLCV